MKSIFLYLFLFPIILFAQKNTTQSSTQPNQTKIAFVKQNELLKAVPNFEMYNREIDSLSNVYATNIKNAQDQLNEKFNLFLKKYEINGNQSLEQVRAKLNPGDIDKFDLYVKDFELIDKSQQNYKFYLDSLYDNKVKPILNKINNAIQVYAKENNINIVYIYEKIVNQLGYIDTGLDITTYIQSKMNN